MVSALCYRHACHIFGDCGDGVLQLGYCLMNIPRFLEAQHFLKLSVMAAIFTKGLYRFNVFNALLLLWF